MTADRTAGLKAQAAQFYNYYSEDIRKTGDSTPGNGDQMAEKNQTILVIYDVSARELAEQVIEQLETEDIARRSTDSAAEEEGGTLLVCMEAQTVIAASSAIIFVTEDAVEDPAWTKEVENVPEDYRIIPVGFPVGVDMSKIPASLEEINFIIPDEYTYESVRDSLSTDPEFYRVKNLLQIRRSQWVISDSNGNLMTDRKQIKEYQRIFSERLAQERDPNFRKQIIETLDYLKTSEKYCRRLMFSAIGRWVFRAALIVLAVIVVTRAVPEYDRASKHDLSVETGQDLYSVVFDAIKMVEISTNRYISGDRLRDARMNLINCINEPWPQSPVGYFYKQNILDISIQSGERYVWTSTDGGRVVKWDTYTGEAAVTFQLCERELPVLAVSENGERAVAVDDTGSIYVCSEGEWHASGVSTALCLSESDCEIRNDLVLLYDGSSYELYDLSASGLPVIRKESFDRLYAACLSGEGEVCLVYSSEDETVVRASFCEESAVDIAGEKIMLCDIEEDQAVFSVGSGRVFAMTGQDPCMLPVLLRQPTALKVIDGRTVLYCDRELGTHLLDTDAGFDYGQFFRKKENVDAVWTERGTAVFDVDGLLAPFSLNGIIPTAGAAEKESGPVYEGKECWTDNGIFRKVSLTSYGEIVLEGTLDGEEVQAVIDPARFIYHELGYRNTKYLQEVPDNYKIYEAIQGLADGVPVTVGLYFVPAGEYNNVDFTYLVIGMDNGSFSEISFDSRNGAGYITSVYTVPSRTAVTSIAQTEEGYIITDETGREWKVRSGSNSESRTGMYRIVKEKLHCSVSQDLLKLISKETAKELELTVCPGSDGKEWE